MVRCIVFTVSTLRDASVGCLMRSFVVFMLHRIKFLIAMDRSDAAVERINTMLARYQALLGEAHTDGSLLAREYKRIFDVLVFQILLPSESIDSVRRSIYSDDILDEVSKQVWTRIVFGCATRSNWEMTLDNVSDPNV